MISAVEWLITELNQELNYIPITKWDRIRDLIQRAKEMEKQQIINAYLKDKGKVTIGKALIYWDKAEEYYNKTYKQNADTETK